MSRRLFPFAELILFSGILAGGYTLVAVARATAIPVAAGDRHDKQATAGEAANPASSPAPTVAPLSRISSAKPPVPLLTSRHATYWVEDPPQSTNTTMESVVTTQPDKKAPSNAAAKAIVEADGYKNVRSLVQAPDGTWRGRAMRGAVEITIIVDANGSVLAD
jgi:hypothetical protein